MNALSVVVEMNLANAKVRFYTIKLKKRYHSLAIMLFIIIWKLL